MAGWLASQHSVWMGVWECVLWGDTSPGTGFRLTGIWGYHGQTGELKIRKRPVWFVPMIAKDSYSWVKGNKTWYSPLLLLSIHLKGLLWCAFLHTIFVQSSKYELELNNLMGRDVNNQWMNVLGSVNKDVSDLWYVDSYFVFHDSWQKSVITI